MKNARLDRILGMVIATGALGARGFSCEPCLDTTEVIPVLPPSPGGGAPDAGVDYDAACNHHCGPGQIECEPTTIPAEDGGTIPAIACTKPAECGAGRRPEGLEEAALGRSDMPGGGGAAGWLAAAAFLEAASVDAFRILRRDLAAHGAPRRLLRAASRAAQDERRRARSGCRTGRRRSGSRAGWRRRSPVASSGSAG